MGGGLIKMGRKNAVMEKNIVFSYSNMIRIYTIENIELAYRILQKIGEGSSGEVFKAIALKTSMIRAIKKIDKFKHPHMRTALQIEYAIFKDHPNIVKMFQIFQTPSYFYIVTELCEGMELFDLLIQNHFFSQKEAAGILFQIVSAVKCMHDHNFMHRDLKPENIMYNPQTKVLKLIDLGSATHFETSQPQKRKRIGTSYYIAPQVLQRCYNQKCDIWSIGVIFYILICGEPPFGGKEDIDVLRNILHNQLQFKNPIWRSTSEKAKNLIKKMIKRDPLQRISIAEVASDEWFTTFLKQIDKGAVEENFIVNCLLNMKKFKEIKSATIQDGILIFIINFVNQNESESEIIKTFKALDLNGDGILSLQEICIGIQKYLKIGKKEANIMAQRIFERVDTNNSGFIDYSQFMIAASNIQLAISVKNIDLAFDCFDENGDERLTVEQFRKKLGTNISQQKYTSLLKQFDKNHDGYISRMQFRQMMRSLLQDKKAK